MNARTADRPPERSAAALLSRSFAFENDVLPLAYDGVELTVGVSEDDPALAERIAEASRKRVRIAVLPVRTIREGLIAAYPAAASTHNDSVAASVLDGIFASAIAAYVSDVHIEPLANRAGRVRFDIDGVLQHERDLENGLFDRVVALVKIRSEMNTGELRVPQDGRMTVVFDGRPFDVRTSTIPIDGCEKVVLRFLARFDLVPHLEQLGMSADLLARYLRAMRKPGSFCCVAGPTGSGKSTTAYASLSSLDLARGNVCSVEDPVECRIPGISQIAVNERAGVTFPTALRALMRQKPTQLFVGELRDSETVSVAMLASLTGISLLATLHARDTLRVTARLCELGAARTTVASTLTLAVSQRLLRTLCRRCKIKTSVSSLAIALMRRFGITIGSEAWDAHGCDACSMSGYVGRIGCFELLEVGPELAGSIERGESPARLAEFAYAAGYRPMIVDALRHVCAGSTSESEVLRHLSYEDLT